MSDCIEFYNDYLCEVLIHGFLRRDGIDSQRVINRDVGSVCIKYIAYPFLIKSPLHGWIVEDDKIDVKIKISKVQTILLYHAIAPKLFMSAFNGSDFTNFDENITSWRRISAQKLYKFHCSMQCVSDTKLLSAMSIIVQFESGKSTRYPRFYDNYGRYDKYFSIIIDLCKRGMNVKCKYMHELIELYEFFYFQINVTDVITKQVRHINQCVDLR